MPRILVIDDDTAVLKATKIMLEARGFEVVAVGSGRLGVERVKAEAFDAVIVDLFMPEMDGLETTRVIHDHNAALPIIAVSGFMFRGRGRWFLFINSVCKLFELCAWHGHDPPVVKF